MCHACLTRTSHIVNREQYLRVGKAILKQITFHSLAVVWIVLWLTQYDPTELIKRRSQGVKTETRQESINQEEKPKKKARKLFIKVCIGWKDTCLISSFSLWTSCIKNKSLPKYLMTHASNDSSYLAFCMGLNSRCGRFLWNEQWGNDKMEN